MVAVLDRDRPVVELVLHYMMEARCMAFVGMRQAGDKGCKI